MNNFKKIGLTALAASLVSVSAHAGEMSVAGSASVGVDQHSGNAGGKNLTMGNQLTFTGGGELDNGLNVALSFVLDQGDGVTATTAPFDSHSITISSDAMGTIVIAGEGAGNAQSALDTTAAGDIWDNGFKSVVSGTETAYVGLVGSDATSNKAINYTLPTLMDDLSVSVSYNMGAAGVESSTAYGVTYTGVEGLSVSYATGDDSSVGSINEATMLKGSYAYGPVTVAYSDYEYDAQTDSADDEMTSYKLSYTVSDELSVSYGQEEITTNSLSAEYEMVSASYTAGGMTITASMSDATDRDGTTTATMDNERWALGASFAF